MLLMVCYHGFAAHSAYPWSSMKAILILLTAMLASLALFFGAGADTEKADPGPGATLYFFWGEGCPHCESAKPFLKELQAKYPALQIKSWEVLEHRENIPLLMEMTEARHHKATGVPVFIIGDRVVSGFGKETGGEIEALVHSALARAEAKDAQQKPPPADAGTVTVPLLGKVDARTASLPVLTIILASLDSFNPCAFFVLFFLLSLLIHAHSRRRMLLIGGIFVFFSGLVYFVFMAAWLNLFLFTGTLPAVTVAAGVIALLVALINIKDFFYFEQGISLVIPEARKPKLFERMRNLLKAGSTLSLVAGTAILALAANSYELLCTAGFPMVYTRMLTLHQLSTPMYYLYLALYNLVYIVPLAIIVAIFTVTLGSRKLTEWQGRVLKLISGLMMLGLGLVLLINPSLLNNPVASAGLLGATLAMAALIILAWKQATRR